MEKVTITDGHPLQMVKTQSSSASEWEGEEGEVRAALGVPPALGCPRPPMPLAGATSGQQHRRRDRRLNFALRATKAPAARSRSPTPAWPAPPCLTCVPTTTICGNWMMSAPTVLNTSCSLLMTGISASIAAGEGKGRERRRR